MKSPLGKAVLRLTGVCLVLVVVVALVAPQIANFVYDRMVVVPVMLACLAVACTFRSPRWLDRRWVPEAVSALGGALGTAVALSLQHDYGWDARVVMTQAAVVQAGEELPQNAYNYLSLYPNNIPLLAIDRVGLEVGDALGVPGETILLLLNGLCIAATLYAVNRVVSPVAGQRRAVVAQVVVLALVGLSPWASLPYTDLFALPFVAGGVALITAAWRRPEWRERLVLGSMGVTAISVAYVIKITPAVIIVAVILVWLVRPGEEWSPRRAFVVLMGALATGTAFVVISAALTAAASSVSGIDRDSVRPDVTPPVVWWVANGMNERPSRDGLILYGSYNGQMVTAIRGRTQDEMKAYARAFIADRWAERGLSGTVEFYAKKAAWNWGDGMFWAWGEGRDHEARNFSPDTALERAVYSVNAFHGQWYALRADITQGVWLAVLLAAGAGLLHAPVKRETLLLAVIVLGIAGFILVFQGRSRYLLVFVPVIVSLAAIVAPRVRSLSRSTS